MSPKNWLREADRLGPLKPRLLFPASSRLVHVARRMTAPLRPLLLVGFCAVLFGLLVGCKSSEQRDDSNASSSSARTAIQPDIVAPSSSVRTVQLYRGDDEQSLPVFSLNGGAPLTLEFDLMAEEGRPLSIYFQHADRHWRRDLTASQTLESFQDDRLLEYRSSRGTQVPYVHYKYRLPNDDIRFRISGNYILRVTERGRRDSVLFEHPFFVAEEEGRLQLGAQPLTISGQRVPSLQPVARYTPPSSVQGDPFGHTVCFIRNGRLTDTRCEERPLLVQQPELEFELGRERAYAPITANYELDLSDLRATSEIVQVDRTQSPPQAQLEPDYARFGEGRGRTMGNGQPIVRGALPSQLNPEVSAEYVETTFAFVPSGERPYTSPLLVTGNFNGLNSGRSTRMDWNSSRGQYEGTVLLKQGRYQYFYSTDDPTYRKQVLASQPRITGTYLAFVYYRDASLNTDRLLRVNGFSP